MKYAAILYVILQIYCLYKGNFTKSAVLTGSVKSGRFGNSITNLGDLNNDGFEGKSLSPLSLSNIYKISFPDRHCC